MAVIETHNLTKRYGRREGVRAVDLAVAEGTMFGFLGPNGAGKTTTIRLLLGFLRPTAGSARVFDLDAWSAGHRIRRDVGYLPGDLRLYAWMTARSALRVSGQVRGRDLLGPGLALAERLRLEPDVPARSMSRGMRQKLGLLLALAHEPRLIVLDEPTSGLDPLMQEELARILRERAAAGHTVFFSSHTLREVEALCDRIAIVRDGRLVADETLADLRRRARRSVRILFRTEADAAQAAPPEGLVLIERSGTRWEAEMTGTAPTLIAWASGQSIEDLLVGPPDLEVLFRGYYRAEAAAETPEAGR